MFIAYVADVLLIFILIGVARVANQEDGEVTELRVDEGGNLTLPCGEPDDERTPRTGQELDDGLQGRVYWVHEGRAIDATVLHDDSLFLEHVRRDDGGGYKCVDVDSDQTLSHIRVLVRTPPPRLVNVTVHASTILALLRWDVADTGGYPISHFTAQYRLKHSSADEPPDEWHKVIPGGRISPAASQIDVYHLEPNSTYLFEVWASNELGEGEVVQVEGTTHHDNEEIELGRHLLEGVETFDTRYWVAAVAVVMGTLVVLALGTCYALYRECHLPLIIAEGEEVMELVPHIILNPFHEEDENANNRTTTRLNNNHVVRPYRV